MAEIKISELEPTTDLEGLYTIGSDKNNLSKKVSLQFLREAADYAIEQGDYAQQEGSTIESRITDFKAETDAKLTELESEVGLYQTRFETERKLSTKVLDCDIKKGERFLIKLSGSVDGSRLILRANDGYGPTIVDYVETDVIYDNVAKEDISSIYLWHENITSAISVDIVVKSKVSISDTEIKELREYTIESIGEFSGNVEDIDYKSPTKMLDCKISTGDEFYIRLSGSVDGSRLMLRANGGYGSTIVDYVEADVWYKVIAKEDIFSIYLWHENIASAISVRVEVKSNLSSSSVEIENLTKYAENAIGKIESQKFNISNKNVTKIVDCSIKQGDVFYVLLSGSVDGSRLMLRANDGYGPTIVDYVEANKLYKCTAKTDINSIYLWHEQITSTISVSLTLDTALSASEHIVKEIEDNIDDNRSYWEGQTLNATSASASYVLTDLKIPQGKKYQVRIVGEKTDSSRLLLFANGTSYDTGSIIASNIELGKWYTTTKDIETNKIGLWYEELTGTFSLRAELRLATNTEYLSEKIDVIDSGIYEKSVMHKNIIGSPTYHIGALQHDSLMSAQVPKKSFVCFRTDDTSPFILSFLPKFASLFESMGFRYSMGLNLGEDYITSKDIQILRELQAKGFDIADHTPQDTTFYVDILPEWESLFSEWKDGILETKTLESGYKRLYLKYEIDANPTEYVYGGGFRTQAGTNKIVGDFSSDGTNTHHAGFNNKALLYDWYLVYVWIDKDNGEVKKGWNIVSAKDDGSISIVDSANNALNFASTSDINISIYMGVPYLGNDATCCLLYASQLWFIHYGLERPMIWIQNGGDHPHARPDALQYALCELNMDSAETMQNRQDITYCFADAVENYNACTWWEQDNALHIDEINESALPEAKILIAKAVAEKRIITIGSHYRYSNFSGLTDSEK